MENRKLLVLGLAVVPLFYLPFLSANQEAPISERILKWTETDQIQWLESYLADGMPPSDAVGLLIITKSSLVLPLIEKKIEAVLRSTSPNYLFSNPSADPQKVINLAALGMALAGNELALQQASKLMKIDEQRFGLLVAATLANAANRANPFLVIYEGFEIGDPSVNHRMIAWVEKQFSYKENHDHVRTRTWWAEAIVAKYEGEPTAVQWTNDPIASRLKSASHPLFHDEMRPFLERAAKARMKK